MQLVWCLLLRCADLLWLLQQCLHGVRGIGPQGVLWERILQRNDLNLSSKREMWRWSSVARISQGCAVRDDAIGLVQLAADEARCRCSRIECCAMSRMKVL